MGGLKSHRYLLLKPSHIRKYSPGILSLYPPVFFSPASLSVAEHKVKLCAMPAREHPIDIPP